MKNIYVYIPLFLTVTVLCIGCRKQESVIIQNNVDITTDSIQNEVSAPVLEEKKTVAETIENYRFLAPEVQETIDNYGLAPYLHETSRKGRFAFQIEGNFTGSGNREIVAFYGGGSSLSVAFCFVFDTSEEKVEEIYNVNWWGTLDYSYQIEAGPGLTEDLGRYIVWKGDRKIGCVGDFNGNGKDELYLYSISGMNRQPYFFEFDETEFVQLLDIGTTNAFIDSVDKEKRIINIRKVGENDCMPSYTVITRSSYIWDNDTRRYVVLTEETKYYTWNIDTEQYEEIVGEPYC